MKLETEDKSLNVEKKITEVNDFDMYVKEDKSPVSENRQEPVTPKEQEYETSIEEVVGISFEFKPLKPAEEEKKEMPVTNAVEDSNPMNKFEVHTEKPQELQTADDREMYSRSQDRTKRLRELSIKIRSQQGLEEMEKEPAYKRRNVELSEVKPSSESEVSRLVLGEDEEKKTELKNNSFLHDNVD
jgi:cell division protein FtsZ